MIKSRLYSLSKIILAIIITTVAVYGIVRAGSLTPTASPAATFYTLTDIYTRLTTNATATEGNHTFSSPASPAASLYTLTQIYAAIPTIDATKVLTGTSYLGVAGTTFASLFNGTLTAGGFAGGSQANGGVDDYNAGNAAGRPTDSYAKSWTACTSGADNYCGTGDSGADAKDNSTGLVWSLPCNGSGCATFSDSSPITYSWDSSGANNNSRTASQLCSDHSGWSLPHQKQLMQAYINGDYGNLEEAAGASNAYWSATTRSAGTTSAWATYLASGQTTNGAKTGLNRVRCVR